MVRVAVCAPSNPFSRERAAAVIAAAAAFPQLEIVFHEQCFERYGHFAGTDAQRRDALLECAEDSAFDAVWFARGGYGAARIAGEAVAAMGPASARKYFLGYSDTGYLLAALYRRGIGRPVHAPMPTDVAWPGGTAAIQRVCAFLTGDDGGLEPSLGPSLGAAPTLALNLTTLTMLTGTDLMPDLSGHVVMVEEVSEYLYAIDRMFFHLVPALKAQNIAGLRLGRISDVPENDRPFPLSAPEIARYWCEKAGIAFLGAADIGHDAENRLVPFGVAARGPVA